MPSKATKKHKDNDDDSNKTAVIVLGIITALALLGIVGGLIFYFLK